MIEENKRVEFGCYTNHSKMLGISQIKEYIDEAKKRGYSAIGITDVDTTEGFIEAYQYAKNLKMIYGVKTRFYDDISVEAKEENHIDITKIYNIMIIVKEQKGLKNLYKMLTNAHKNKSSKGPYILKSELNQYREGLLIGSYGTEGEVYKAVENEKSNLEILTYFYDFIQVEPMYCAKQKVYPSWKNYNKEIVIKDKTEEMQEIIKKIVILAENCNVLIIANSNPIFVNEEDSICIKILRHSQNLPSSNYYNKRYFHTTEELLKEFEFLGKEVAYKIVIENTQILNEICIDTKINIQQK